MMNTHYRPILRSALLVLSLFGFVSIPLHAQNDVLFPHVFNLDDDNNSSIYVQNLNDSESIDVTVTYVGQDGMTAGTEMKSLDAFGSTRFISLPAGFQGVAQVSCTDKCAVTGTWNFRLPGQGDFAVGISPMDPMKTSTMWAAPIPLIGENSGFGIAVHNVGTSPTTCSAFYYGPDGEQVVPFEGFPPNQGIPVGGQTAFLSASVPGNIPPEDVGPDGFEGGLLLTCFEPVIPVVVNQDQVNGFPTPISMEVREVPSGE